MEVVYGLKFIAVLDGSWAMNSVKLKWVYKVETERRMLGESECLDVERRWERDYYS